MPKGLDAAAAVTAVAGLPNGNQETGEHMVKTAKGYATETEEGYATWLTGGIAVTYHPATQRWDVESFPPYPASQ